MRLLPILIAILLSNFCFCDEFADKHGIYRVQTPIINGQSSFGTCFAVEKNNEFLILATAAHVTASNKEMNGYYSGAMYRIETSDGKDKGLAECIYINKDDDLSFLRLKHPEEISILPLDLVSNYSLEMNTTKGLQMKCYGYGNGKWTVTSGFISVHSEKNLYCDCVCVAGQSGGPMISSGKIVGLISSGHISFVKLNGYNATWPAHGCSSRNLKERLQSLTNK